MKYCILALSVIMLFASCSKTPNPQATSKEDILRSGNWRISGGTVRGKLPSGLDTTVSYTQFLLPTCWLDDYIKFDSDYHAKVYSNTNKCDPSQPTYQSFYWKFNRNATTLDFYNGFNLTYAWSDSIAPWHFDTLVNDGSASPPLVLDTIYGVNDTLLGYTRVVVVLDTIWDFVVTPKAIPNLDIYNAQISNFTESSFTLNYTYRKTYTDTNGHHTGRQIFPIGSAMDTVNYDPILKADTLFYSITFSKF